MQRKINHVSSIGRAYLVFTAFMVAQNGLQSNVQAADILSKYKNGYNVNKVCHFISAKLRFDIAFEQIIMILTQVF